MLHYSLFVNYVLILIMRQYRHYVDRNSFVKIMEHVKNII